MEANETLNSQKPWIHAGSQVWNLKPTMDMNV